MLRTASGFAFYNTISKLDEALNENPGERFTPRVLTSPFYRIPDLATR